MSNHIASALLTNRYGEIVRSSALEGKVVALYLSASWCPPCRNFVPLLKKFYETVKAHGENFEIIAVPGDDREPGDFKNYLYRDHGNWLAVMPGSRDCAQLSKHYLYGIPSLLVIDRHGHVVVSDGKGDVVRAESERSIMTTFANWKNQAGVWIDTKPKRLPDPYFAEPLLSRSPSGQLSTGQVTPLLHTEPAPRTTVLPRRLPEYPLALPGSPHVTYNVAASPSQSRFPSIERAAYGHPSAITLPPASYAFATPLPTSPYESQSVLACPPPVPPVPLVLRNRLDALEQNVNLQWQHQQQQQQPRGDFNAVNDEYRRIEGLERQYRIIQLENQALQKEIESIKLKQQSEVESIKLKQQVESPQAEKVPNVDSELHLGLLRERDQLQSRHEEVLRENSRLQADFQKLQLDHAAEMQTRSSIARKHEEVNKDSLQLKDDLQRLQEAHAAELHSTKGDFEKRHLKAEEAAANVWRDFQNMQADRDAEQRLRIEAEAKSQAIFQDALKLRADFENVEAALHAEQQSHERLQLRHQELDSDNKQMRADLLDFGERHNEREASSQNWRKRLEAEQKENVALKEKLEDLTGDLDGAHARIESLTAKLKSAEVERDLARKDVDLLRKANNERELEIKALRSSPRVSTFSRQGQSLQREINPVGSKRSSIESLQYEINPVGSKRSSIESLQYEINRLPAAPPVDLGEGFLRSKKVEVNLSQHTMDGSEDEIDATMMVDLTGSDSDTARVVGFS